MNQQQEQIRFPHLDASIAQCDRIIKETKEDRKRLVKEKKRLEKKYSK